MIKQKLFSKTEVIIGQPTGFCSGVKRAIALVKKEALKRKNSTPVYTLGPIIHNAEVVKEIKRLGVQTVTGIEGLKKVTSDVKKKSNQPVVIIRSHGCAPQVVSKIKKMGYRVVDATCPYVRRVQNYASHLKDYGYAVVMVGDKNHPEVKGILGHAEPSGHVYDVNSKLKIKTSKLDGGRIGIIGQTTIPFEYFQSAINSFNVGGYNEIRIFNTLCKEALNRQKICKNIADKVDLMVVIGSRNSANTRHLADIARTSNAKVYQVENKSELQKEWFRNLQHIGVVAGTSTPQDTVFDVVKLIRKILENKGEYANGK
jgi:small subunit ribosomal protein S1